ncbi:exported hypothetical protein [Micrococcus luteus]|nr:exported hypothetical protein [Micrococcus luteus]
MRGCIPARTASSSPCAAARSGGPSGPPSTPTRWAAPRRHRLTDRQMKAGQRSDAYPMSTEA